MSSTTTTTVSGPDTSPGASSSSTTGTEATLRSLYSRAAKSFLNRDVPQTHALITSAFQLVPPPPSTITDVDCQLSIWRRKWEILRLTLETTVYSTPPNDVEELPSSIRANLMLSPQSLLASLHTRSLKLFTPWNGGSDGDAASQRSLSARYLPPQVVVTLILASMKLNAPEVGKGIVEDWLSGRGDPEGVLDGGDGYEKIIELYCLHLLPRLEEWDLAADFLQYEGELDVAEKQVRPSISFCVLSDRFQLDDVQKLVTALENIRSDVHSSRHRSRTPSTPALSPSRSRSQSRSRPSSPAPSSSSESSEKTETPYTARFKAANAQGDTKLNGNVKMPFDPLSMSSISVPSSLSSSTDTSRTATPVPIPVLPPTPISGSGKPRYRMRYPRKPSPQKQTPISLSNGDLDTLPIPPLVSDPSSVLPSQSSRVLTTSSYPSGPLALLRSGYHSWKAYLLSAKPSVGTVLFAIAALIGIVHYLRTRRRLRAASGITPVVPIGMKEEGLAHLASIGGELAGSSNKSVVDEVRRRLTVGRDWNAGFLGGLWNETKKVIGDTVQMAGQGLV